MNTGVYQTNKKTLRKVFLEKRKSLTEAEHANRNVQLLYFANQKLLQLDFQTVHCFLPIKKQKEVNTWPVIELLEIKGKKIIVSRSNPHKNELTPIEYEGSSQLVVNRWGIPEPTRGKIIDATQIDLVLIPLVVFDRQGHRIGYGRGYYDVFLSRCRKDCIKIGLSLSPPLDQLPLMESFDVQMDYCVTPVGIYSFNQ